VSASPPSAGRGIALALGGGAALGWAHIGVLRVFEEGGIEIGAIAGTSIGALAALCFATGKLDAMETLARGATKKRVRSYLDISWRKGSLLGGQRIARELRTHLGDVRLEQVGLPIALVAADLDSAREIRLSTGPAVEAAQASMALPAVFAPVTIDGRRLIDGGLVACVPIAAARALAPDRPLVAVDLMSDFAGHVSVRPPGTLSALGVARSAFLMMMVQQTRAAIALDPPDVLLALPIGHIGTGAFTRADELIAIGRAAATTALPAIRSAIAA